MDEGSLGKPKPVSEMRPWDEATELSSKISDMIGYIALSTLKHGFAAKIYEHYPDQSEYLLYHFLIGSSGSGREMTKIDFPEPEYSVIGFFRDTFNKIKAVEKTEEFEAPADLAQEAKRELYLSKGFVDGSNYPSEDLRRMLLGQAVSIVNYRDGKEKVMRNLKLKELRDLGNQIDGFDLPDGNTLVISKPKQKGSPRYRVGEGWLIKIQRYVENLS